MSKSSVPPRPAIKPKNLKVMRAIYDYKANDDDELSFNAGDILYVLDSTDPDWWKARCKGIEGLFPCNLVENVVSETGTGPLHDAAKRGNIELLKECLLNRMPVNQPDPAGNTALHWAARSGQFECLKELLDVSQVNIESVNKLGDTALMLAVAHTHANCVELLLKGGADATKINDKVLKQDSEILIVLKKYNIISDISNGYKDEEYEVQSDEE